MIPDDVIDEVRARADIVDIIGEIVPLKKAGREYKANCPFHEERTPSFYVVPDKGFYKCFGCGKSGSVFDFVMERQGMDFVEAVKYVAGRSGVEVRETTRSNEEEDPNRPFYEISAFARDWFRGRLLDEAGGAGARAYLEGRGIGAEVAERFGLGFAPDEWRALRDAAGKHGFEDGMMLALGLLKESERSKEPYDGFRGRVMFPIEGLSGKVIAFGGRILEGEGPKYINSPETPIYHKGHNLYGLSWAKNKIRREEAAIVVEGYMDVVSLVAAGFEHVVAPLGTALTPEQAKLLSRYCTRVLLLFDSDAAGLKATFKAGDVLLEAGMHPAVVTLPPGEDPDTLVRSGGSAALTALMDDAVDVLDRKLQILDEHDYFASIERTRSAVDRLLPTLRAAKDPALRDIYVAKVADRTGVRRDTLETEMQKTRPASVPRRPDPMPRQPPTLNPRIRKHGAELQLLKVMVRGVEWVERAAELIADEDFYDPLYRAIFRALLDDPEMRAPPAAMDPVAAQRFDEILSDPEELAHGIDVFTNSVNRMRVLALDRRVQDLQRQIEAATSDDEKLELTTVKAELASELRELDPNYWAPAARRTQANYISDESRR
ncbi:MAG: DNA primase [Gemmatimonadetes bacterium]|nr:DNA primase [Gemmatimonadota bacterium]